MRAAPGRAAQTRGDHLWHGRLLRKDLGLARANAVQQRHAEQFPRGEVSTLQREAKRHLPIWTSHDTSALQVDDIRAAVVDYGERDTKIESLAQLNALCKAHWSRQCEG